MDKKVLKEYFTIWDQIMTAIVVIPLTIKLINTVRYYIKKKKSGGGPVTHQEQYDTILKDRDFIKELAKIIKEEGDIDKFIEKIKPIKPNDDIDDFDRIWFDGGWNSRGWKEWASGPEPPKVIDRLLKSAVFQKHVKKYNWSKGMIEKFGNTFYFTLTDPNFKKIFKHYAIDAAKEVQRKKKKGIKDSKIYLKALLPKNI